MVPLKGSGFVECSSYHHGLVIKEYRERLGKTQEWLASQWYADGSGVSVRYVKAVEAGQKLITDQQQLRHLSEVLAVPLWKFGLSEFNPFAGQFQRQHGHSLFQETLQLVECLIHQAWRLRYTVALPHTEQVVQRLRALFTYCATELPSNIKQERTYIMLLAQYYQLLGVVQVERKQYRAALQSYEQMQRAAEQIEDTPAIVLALMCQGTELERLGQKQDAVQALELARDRSFETSKQIAVFIHAYLARVYASSHDALRFERAVQAARNLASKLTAYGDGTDFLYHSLSGVMAEASYGYLDIGEPLKTLALRPDIERQIEEDNNRWLHAWVPLDYARAYRAIGEIEASVAEARTFFKRGLTLQSPHVVSRSVAFLQELEEAGYQTVTAVKELHEEILETAQTLQPELRISILETLRVE
uniref:HTH cro/C1-type domain-containing protein n=1 Tax=Thermosporothrix sp. COM3 TaxID=2490863 RepID=A0A455SNX3_9CHLR|nr:hypothetical protein KTC_15450 [Thermosporothrix sp. COM3]